MLGLVAVLVHQRVGDGDVRLFLRSVNCLLRRTDDLAVLGLQPLRKALNLDGVLLQLEALRQFVKAFRLHFLLVRLTDNTVGQLGVRHRDLGDYLLLTLLRDGLLLGLLNALFRIFFVRVLVDRVAVVVKHRHFLLHHDLDLAGHDDLGGARGGRLAGDLAGLRVDLQACRQVVSRVGRFSALLHIVRQILEQRRDVVIREVGSHRTQRQRLRNNSGEGVCDLPTIRRLTGSRVNRNQRSGVDGCLLQVFRSLEITRLERTLVIALDLAHRVLDLGLGAVRGGGVPTDCVLRVRQQAGRLRGHLGAGTTLVVVGVVLRNIEDRLCSYQRELQTVHVRASNNGALVAVVHEHVGDERRVLHVATLDVRVDVHVVSVDVAHVVQRSTGKHVDPLVLIVVGDFAPVFVADHIVHTEVGLVARVAQRALERQVNRAVVLRRGNHGLRNVGAFAVLILVRLDDAFLVRTLLLNGVVRVLVLPGVNLTRDFVVEVRRDNLDSASGAIAAARLVLVVTRQGTGRLTSLPPHHGLVRVGNALDRAKVSVVRELTINRRLTSLAIEGSGPILLRLSQPTNVVRLLFQHKTAVGNTGTSRACSKVPRFLHTVRNRGVTTRVEVTRGNHRVLAWIRVLAPHTDANATGGQPERRRVDLVGHVFRQVEGEATLGIGRGIERRRDLTVLGHVLQVDDIALERLIVRRQVIVAAILIDVRPAVVAIEITPATLSKDGVWHLLVLTLALLGALVSA